MELKGLVGSKAFLIDEPANLKLEGHAPKS